MDEQLIVDTYDALKDVVNADDNGDGYTGEELQEMLLPLLEKYWRLLPITHADYQVKVG